MAGTSLVRNTRAVAAALACASRANSSRPGQRTSCPTSSNSTRLTNNFSPPVPTTRSQLPARRLARGLVRQEDAGRFIEDVQEDEPLSG